MVVIYIYVEIRSLSPYRGNVGGSVDIFNTKEEDAYSSNWVKNCSFYDA
jgi:hypothetical protein